MKRHLFFTGEKGVGKSTLVELLLERARGGLGGFRTRRLYGVFPGQYSVHLLRADRREEPGEENLLFLCGGDRSGAAARFDLLGCAAFAAEGEHSLLLMDELGPNEERALEFTLSVKSALDGPVSVLGVLQRAESAFLEGIAARGDVLVAAVTRENRDALARKLAALPPMDGGELVRSAAALLV